MDKYKYKWQTYKYEVQLQDHLIISISTELLGHIYDGLVTYPCINSIMGPVVAVLEPKFWHIMNRFLEINSGEKNSIKS